MTRASLVRTAPTYAGLEPPFGPGTAYPESAPLLGPQATAPPPNPVYAAVRAALAGLGLDAARRGSAQWNPLGDLVGRGGRVVLKPNFIRHWNPSANGTLESVITHGSVIRAMADYAFLAVGPEGSVTLAEAPQMDCDFDEIRRRTGLNAIAAFYAEVLGRELGIVDLRQEAVIFRDGIITERRRLPGDPLGYRVVDLADRSFFHGSGLDAARFRGADYDPEPTGGHHRGGRHEYLLSETVLSSDLVVNLPKLKTHKKTGVTLALKNLVGINGDKNWLPHHCLGAPGEGGDEFPGRRWVDRLRSRAADLARPWLHRGRGLGFFRTMRRVERAARGDDFIRAGNWHGNRTTWRMCLDLNRCLYYSDRKGLHIDSGQPVRTVLTLLDGVVAGESAGPLAPDDVPLGAVIAGTDPLAVDVVAVRLMGFAPSRIPKLCHAMADEGPRFTSVRTPDDVRVTIVDPDTLAEEHLAPHEIECPRPFRPHAGWRHHIEESPR